MGLTSGKIPKAADATHIQDGYTPVTSVGDPGTDVQLPTEKATRDALNLKAALTHASRHTNGSDDIQNATAAQKGLATAAQITKLDGIEAAADVTDTANVTAAGAVMGTVFDAKGDILVASGDNAYNRLPVGTNDQVLIADNGQALGVKWGVFPPVPRLKTFFVGKHGNDGYAGTSPEKPFLTIAAAIAAAIVAVPGVGNPLAISVVDSGIYVESFTIPSYVQLSAQMASVIGNMILNDSCEVFLRWAQATSGTLFTKSSGTGDAAVFINSLVLTGIANGFACSAGNILVITNEIIVSNGYGVGSTGTTAGIDIKCNRIYVSGTGAGIAIGNTGLIVATIEQINAPSGTGINVNGTGTIIATVAYLTGSIAYSVTTGTLYLNNNYISGTQTTASGGVVKFGSRRKTSLIVYTVGTVAYGDYRVNAVGQNASFNITFRVPDEFTSLISLKVVGILGGTIVTQSVTLNSDYGAIGEAYNNHSETQGISISATAGVITSFDVSGVFTSLAAGDSCGLKWQNNAIGQTFNHLYTIMEYYS